MTVSPHVAWALVLPRPCSPSHTPVGTGPSTPGPRPLWSVRHLAPQVTVPPHPRHLPAGRPGRQSSWGQWWHSLSSLMMEEAPFFLWPVSGEGGVLRISPPQLFVTHPLPCDGRWGCAISTHLPQGRTPPQMVWTAAVHPAATCWPLLWPPAMASPGPKGVQTSGRAQGQGRGLAGPRELRPPSMAPGGGAGGEDR